MNTVNFFVTFALLWQLNAFASSTQTPLQDQEEIRAINQQLEHLVSDINEDGIVKFLQTPENNQNIDKDTLVSVISLTAWDELTKALEELLKHPMCQLKDLQELYVTINNYFWGKTETKKLLKQKIKALGGKDPDASSDDENTGSTINIPKNLIDSENQTTYLN